jgi:hypothetical protein
MPQTSPSFSHVTLTSITPITCSYCGGNAHLISLTPQIEIIGELPTFECQICSKQTQMPMIWPS